VQAIAVRQNGIQETVNVGVMGVHDMHPQVPREACRVDQGGGQAYTSGMKTTPQSAAGILGQIAAIERMEPGKLCVIREGPQGPYYNLQSREGGQPVCRYVPREQAELVRQHTENYRQFEALVEEYAQVIITRTRQERLAAEKKSPRRSSVSRSKNSPA
jgi:hypothetical protein